MLCRFDILLGKTPMQCRIKNENGGSHRIHHTFANGRAVFALAWAPHIKGELYA
jgi:hypothetical protein